TRVVLRASEATTPPPGTAAIAGGSRPRTVQPSRPDARSPFGGPGTGGGGGASSWALGAPVSGGRAGAGPVTTPARASAAVMRKGLMGAGATAVRVPRDDRRAQGGRRRGLGRRRRGRHLHGRGRAPRRAACDGEGAHDARRPERGRGGGRRGGAGPRRARRRGGGAI